MAAHAYHDNLLSDIHPHLLGATAKLVGPFVFIRSVATLLTSNKFNELMSSMNDARDRFFQFVKSNKVLAGIFMAGGLAGLAISVIILAVTKGHNALLHELMLTADFFTLPPIFFVTGFTLYFYFRDFSEFKSAFSSFFSNPSQSRINNYFISIFKHPFLLASLLLPALFDGFEVVISDIVFAEDQSALALNIFHTAFVAIFMPLAATYGTAVLGEFKYRLDPSIYDSTVDPELGPNNPMQPLLTDQRTPAPAPTNSQVHGSPIGFKPDSQGRKTPPETEQPSNDPAPATVKNGYSQL